MNWLRESLLITLRAPIPKTASENSVMGDPEKEVAVITCGLDLVRLRRSGVGGVCASTTGSDQSEGSSQQLEGEVTTLTGLGFGFIAGAGTVIGGERSVSPRPLPPWGGGDCPRAFEAREAVQVPIVESELHTLFQERGVYGRGRPSPLSSGQPAKP